MSKAAEEAHEATDWVYLMRFLEYYKIGCSINPAARRLQIDTPFPPDLVHVIASDRADRVEAALHHRFHAKHVQGEWFRLDEEDVALIRSVSRCDSVSELPEALRPTINHQERWRAEKEAFGRYVETMRKRRRFSEAGLCRRADVSLKSYRKIINGKTLPRNGALPRLAKALSVDYDTFVELVRVALATQPRYWR